MIEHAIGHVIWESLNRLEGLSQRPLERAVANSQQLYADPAARLAGGEITIGPVRKYFTAGALGGGLGFAAGGVCAIGVGGTLVPFPGQAFGPLQLLAYTLCLILGPLGVWIGWGLMRGGTCVLSGQGVEFRYCGMVVSCPWALFNAPGQVFFRDGPTKERKDFAVPVWSEAVPYVKAHKGGRLQAQGSAVKTPQLRFPSATEVMLQAVYEVEPEELGPLLRHVGRTLGTALPTDRAAVPAPTAPDAVELQPAVRGEDGWITLRLTRLVLPPLCCNCGAATSGTQSLMAASRNRAEHFEIAMPICPTCRSAVRARLRKPSVIGLGIGLLLQMAILSWCLWLYRADAQPFRLMLWVLFLSSILPLGGYLWARVVGMRRHFPARVGRYAPKKGTLAICFRNPRYAEAVLAAMNEPADFPPQRTA
jgi:hypothetical protein